MSTSAPIRVLIVNPNTSQHMTDALRPVVDSLGFENVTYTYFTSPTPGIPSINSPADAEQSATICLPALLDLLPTRDAILIACYSQHPLVPQLQSAISSSPLLSGSSSGSSPSRPKHVTGIFEASITASLTMIAATPQTSFGIVSTGAVWKPALQSAVDSFLGAPNAFRFLGCETTNLNASELHDLPPEAVQGKMKDATKRLVRAAEARGTKLAAVCLGCAGMVGLEDAVRQACVEALGSRDGEKVKIVDGVKAGVAALVGLVRCGF